MMAADLNATVLSVLPVNTDNTFTFLLLTVLPLLILFYALSTFTEHLVTLRLFLVCLLWSVCCSSFNQTAPEFSSKCIFGEHWGSNGNIHICSSEAPLGPRFIIKSQIVLCNDRGSISSFGLHVNPVSISLHIVCQVKSRAEQLITLAIKSQC